MDIEWMPILSIAGSSRLGVLRNGEWVAERGGELWRLVDVGFFPAFPLLEGDREQISDGVFRALREYGIGDGEQFSFPVNRLLEGALVGGMEYWAVLALGWLDGIDMDSRLLQALSRLEHAPWASEETKNRARKVLGLSRIPR
ncbi:MULTISPECIES: hypothetical protein [Myxococcus]|uniref:hypothetical protein n=1 Tax=Myxococcus TaxID=32 RepID=UPI001141DC6A|nr:MULTISPECIES: hypothetical protein [Myxococcus]NOK01955.1 hypothetical protein [Myxococcus xanthus]